MSCDVIFVVPPVKYKSFFLDIKYPNVDPGLICPPIGVATVASVLEKAGYSVKIIEGFALKLKKKDIIEQIKKEEPKIVGITARTVDFSIAMDLLKSVKSAFPEIKTVIGGPHVTLSPYGAISSDFVDFVVIGEGEYTMLELTDSLLKGSIELDQIKGIYFKKAGRVKKTGPRELIRNLDVLPLPAYNLLPMNSYRPNLLYDLGNKKKFISMVTSRGCPYKCIFCATPKLWKGWRSRSVKKIMEEIFLLYENYKKSNIFFMDDEFTFDKKRVEYLCDAIIESGLNLSWGCLSRVDFGDERLFKKMFHAGCKKMIFGIETGYTRGLKKIKKHITLEQVEKSVAMAQRSGIEVTCSYVFGFPWENKNDINRTFYFAKKLNTLSVFSNLVPYPGTEVYEMVKRENLFIKNPYNNYVSLIKTKYLSRKELINLGLKSRLVANHIIRKYPPTTIFFIGRWIKNLLLEL